MKSKIILIFFVASIIFAFAFFDARNIDPAFLLENYFGKDHFFVKKRGTVHYDPSQIDPGYTIMSSRTIGGTVDHQTTEIINMEGEILHQWKTSFEYSNQKNKPDRDHQVFKLLENGDALVLSYEKGLARIDWNSEPIWNLDGFFHHDIQVSDKYIYTLKWKNNFIEYNGHVLPIMDEILVTLDHNGNIISEVSLFETFRHLLPDEAYENILKLLYEEEIYELMQERPKDYYLKSNLAWDIFHMNALYYIDADTDFFREGQFLVSMRSINTIAVFDLDTMKTVWEYTGDLIKQHNPILLSNGNILVYNNGGVENLSSSIINGKEIMRAAKRMYTEIIEIDPFNKKIVWKYVGKPKKSFFSKIMGSVQRLKNGNTLIVDSVNGVIYEITPNKEIVWEHHTPEFGMNHYRVYRLTANEMNLVDDKLKSK